MARNRIQLRVYHFVPQAEALQPKHASKLFVKSDVTASGGGLGGLFGNVQPVRVVAVR